MRVCELYVGPASKHGDRPECGKPAVWVVGNAVGPLMYLCDKHASSPDREPGPIYFLPEDCKSVLNGTVAVPGSTSAKPSDG